MPPAVTLSPTGRVALVTCAGELDIANAGGLRRALRSATGCGAVAVVVDLRAVTFVDSTVLGVLVEAHQVLTPSRRLVVANASGLPLRTLQITGLDRVLEVVDPEVPLVQDDLDAALRA